MARKPAASRSPFVVAFGFSLMASFGLMAAAAPATAQPMKFRNAQIETLGFDKLDGWKDDNQAAAFAAYLKSCRAILNATPAMRKARPIYGGLFNACRNATVVTAGGNLTMIDAGHASLEDVYTRYFGGIPYAA